MARHEQKLPPDVEIDDLEEEDITLTRWKVDRHVPVALLLAICLQTGAAFWWGGVTSTRIENLERDRASAAVAVEVASKASSALSERVVEIKIRVDGLADSLKEIKEMVRQVPTRAAP